MVSQVVGEYVVTGVGQVFHLDHEIDFNGIKVAPGLTKVPLETCATHRQGVIENNQLVAFSAPHCGTAK